MTAAVRTLRHARGELAFGHRTLIMGILNCTPDSFYAGSRLATPDEAVAAGLRMLEEGADLLDVGGESTRPGSDPVPEGVELSRVLPVVTGLARRTAVPISVDTYRAGVARRALDAGAAMVNDVSALRADPGMLEVVRASGAAVVLMHMKGRPKDMQAEAVYQDLVGEVRAFLEERVAFAEAAGASRDRILVDPGIGFAKTAEQSLELIRRLAEMRVGGCGMLLGVSRKSFIGKILDVHPEERLEGTAAAVALGIAAGADVVRVHDVRPMARVARVADAIVRSSPGGAVE